MIFLDGEQMKTIILFLFISITSVKINAQSGEHAQGMMPIGIDNVWTYENNPVYHTRSIWKFSNEIETIDSNQYNILIAGYIGWPQYVRLRKDGYYVLRRDSTYNEPNHEEIYYKKDAKLGDSWTQHLIINDTLYYTSVVTDTFLLSIFDTVVTGKVVHKDLGLNIIDELWTEEFGLVSTADFWGVMYYITGCVINGRIYGDTTTTSVEYESVTVLPERIELFQNYPNPFNGQTTIHYFLPVSSYISVTIYDILGREIKQLYSGEENAGHHYKSWTPGDESSGIYLIVLKTKETQLNNKIIYLK